ncbi:hypothetical protein ACJMK2_008210, partial [Sinanodonta woodiana]
VEVIDNYGFADLTEKAIENEGFTKCNRNDRLKSENLSQIYTKEHCDLYVVKYIGRVQGSHDDVFTRMRRLRNNVRLADKAFIVAPLWLAQK